MPGGSGGSRCEEEVEIVKDMNEITKYAVELQKSFCRANKMPLFISESGTCFRCGRNIFGPDGISVENAAAQLITGCPYCNASFCD